MSNKHSMYSNPHAARLVHIYSFNKILKPKYNDQFVKDQLMKYFTVGVLAFINRDMLLSFEA